jgi:predicted nucleic acid-binding protein
MIAYLDASVVLRVLLGEPGRLAEWSRINRAVASALTEVECLRTLDRLTRQGDMNETESALRRSAVFTLFESVEVVEITRSILRRASEPFPAPLGTLDAIHLSSAIAWRDFRDTDLVVATHDQAFALAARSVGLRVVGV